MAGGPGRPVAGNQEGTFAPRHGSESEALLLGGWAALAAREGRTGAAHRRPPLRRIEVDGEPVHPAQPLAASASDVLSEQLEVTAGTALRGSRASPVTDAPGRRISDVHAVEVPSFASVAERHLDDVHSYLVYFTRDWGLAET
jgi:hypothetical protein